MTSPTPQSPHFWYRHRTKIQQWAVGSLSSLLIWLLFLSSVGLSEELPSRSAVVSPDLGGAPPPEMLLEQPLRSRLSSGDIASEKVNQFVQAYLQVLQLIEQHEGELQGAETELEAQQIERQVEAGALSVIKAVGLTQQEYLQLLGLANVDPEFGERIAAQLQELT